MQAGCAKVIIASRKEAQLKEACDKLNALGLPGKASYIVSNVSTFAGVEKLGEDLKKMLPDGKLHILVNNAAASWGGPFEEFEDWKVAKTLDVNVRAVFNVTRVMQPFLVAAGTKDDPARNIIVSSVGGIIVSHVGKTGAIIYGASKAAAHHLTRHFALEHIPHNITTNTIAPGWFPTRLANPAIEKAGGADVAGASNPTGRLGVPEDIAGVAVYLASRAGRYVNGEDISVDGGSRLMNPGAMQHIKEVREKYSKL
ncbi:hypothetical protein, variant [Verruconis gallopava]|nr:hypothetical protein, variant [Verruconis gallopava]KIW05934.1 hypothetical protein, variant [Verruconis gallopava]